jgi:hypothetical protein
MGDVIASITITGDVKSLLERKAAQVTEWNKILDAKFPDLKPSLLTNP